MRVERIDDDAGLEQMQAVMTACMPEAGRTVASWHNSLRLDAEARPYLAYLGERAVGTATVGRIFMYPPEFDGLWADVAVLPEARRQGAGTALYRAVSERARERGKTTLMTAASGARPETLDWLAKRGFDEIARSRTVALTLSGLEPPEPALPPGITITTLAERPDLDERAYAVAVEAYPDVPATVAPPISAGTFAEWRIREIEDPEARSEAFFLALDASGGVLGYATLCVPETQPGMAFHGMTAVRRDARGRGIAKALKRRCIAWGIAQGYDELETENDVENAPMRAINLAYGYEPRPDRIVFQGPLHGE